MTISTVCRLGDRQLVDGGPRADAGRADPVEEFGGAPFHGPAVDESVPGGFPAEEDVLGDGAVGQERELLVDDADSGCLGLGRVAEGVLGAVDREGPGVG